MRDATMGIAAVILAAGEAARFGSDKRQALLPDGRSMLDAVLAAYAPVFERVLLVTRDRHDAFAARLADIHGAHMVVNEHAELGMGHSLACAAQHLEGSPEIEGVVIGMADMPAVLPSTLLDIRHALLARGRPVVPVYQGRLGQPRGLPRNWIGALARLTGDEGARRLLDWRQAHALHVNDPGVLLDADTPEDLARLHASP